MMDMKKALQLIWIALIDKLFNENMIDLNPSTSLAKIHPLWQIN
jgi:hypothetical protein